MTPLTEDERYTDRDVRENEDLRNKAYDYLENYGGDFSFLIDCRRRVEDGMGLTVGMIRGVLNCMRVDPRYRPIMPAPLPALAEVIPMKKQKKNKRQEPMDCPLMKAGIFHHHKGWSREIKHCPGLYRINRNVVYTTPKINKPLAKGKSYTTTLIHKVDEGDFHQITWYPAFGHKYGFGHNTLSVKVACKIPSWLRDPILLDYDDVTAWNSDPDLYKGEPIVWRYCPRCFPDSQGNPDASQG